MLLREGSISISNRFSEAIVKNLTTNHRAAMGASDRRVLSCFCSRTLSFVRNLPIKFTKGKFSKNCLLLRSSFGVFDALSSPLPCSLLPYFVVSSTWNITRRKISLSLTFYRGRFSRKKYELLIGGKSNFMLVYVTAHRYILKQRCSPLFVPRQIESGRVGSRGLCKSSRYPIHHHSHTLVFISFRFFFP